ncbi:MAG: aspartate aminotransferase family protein [Ruminococcaceae bacterium]|nr:aspartate aminotransferase family protein [Oscillospiraceae bacterium]
MNIYETDNQYVAGTYSRFPVSIVSGKGSRFYDDKGKEYIDLASGIAVNTFGACDDEWISAVTKQLSTLQHTSNLYYTEPCSTLAKMLCERTGMKKVFFSNSGAEANECAIKAARRRAFLKYGDGHHTIITLKNSFHGRTVTTLAATGQDSFHTEFHPFTEGFVYADANDFESVKEFAHKYKCAAIMFEPIQGEGGVMPLDKEFVKKIFELAKELDILTIADEVQTGNGRTGMLYAYMNYGVIPDIVSTAKGLGGGLPIGATLLGEKAKDAFTYGTHGSTFGGNPICCAAAINVLSRIDDNLLSEVRAKSEYIKSELSSCKGVRSVNGMGLMIGIDCEKNAKDVILKCIERGVLVISAKSKVRLLPSLNIPTEDLKKAITILKEVISE